MAKVKIYVEITSDEGNSCPTREHLNKLLEMRLFEMAQMGGYIPEGCTVWPFTMEVQTGHKADLTAYWATGEFQGD